VSFDFVRGRRAAVSLAVLPGAALLLAACQSQPIDSGPPTFSLPKPAATLSAPTTAANFSGPTPTTPQATPTTAAPPAEAPEGTASGLADYLLKHYSTAPWYGDVTRVDTVGKTLYVQSALTAGSGATTPAHDICRAVRSWQTSSGGAGTIEVDGNGGIQLVRVTKSQSC
jgi:hypothetical protein